MHTYIHTYIQDSVVCLPLPLDPGRLLARLDMTGLLSFHIPGVDGNGASCRKS